MATHHPLADPPAGTATPRRLRALALVLSMISSVTLVAALAAWDTQRESAATLEDFAEEQAALARSLAGELSTRLLAARRDALIVAGMAGQPRVPPLLLEPYAALRVLPAQAPAGPLSADPRAFLLSVPVSAERRVDVVIPMGRLLAGMSRVERPNVSLVLVLPPGRRDFYTTDGEVVTAAPLRAALEMGRSWVRLEPHLSAQLGLPARVALAGLARVDVGAGGPWQVAAVASALRERDRERRARWRAVLAVLVGSGLVFAFGGVALLQQRKELDLKRELAIADLKRERDGRLERASKAAMMGTLAMGITHEISTPLGVISGRAEQLLPRVDQDERAARSVRSILEQAERIGQIVRGFLGLVRGDRPPVERIDPAGVVRGAVGLVEHRFATAGVRLAVNLGDALPALRGDRRLLEHAVVNLLLNACDACRRGGEVAVSVHAVRHHVVFEVIDDGIGVSPADAQRALEPFFTTKPAGQGAGLGLAVANEIVKSHRGVLSLCPRELSGTRATIQLPLAPGDPDHA